MSNHQFFLWRRYFEINCHVVLSSRIDKAGVQPKGISDDQFHLFGAKTAKKSPFAMAIPKKTSGFPSKKPCYQKFMPGSPCPKQGDPHFTCCWMLLMIFSFPAFIVVLFWISSPPWTHHSGSEAVALPQFFLLGFEAIEWRIGSKVVPFLGNKSDLNHPSTGVPHVFFSFSGGFPISHLGLDGRFFGGCRLGPSRRIWTSCGERCVKFNGSDDDPVGFFFGVGVVFRPHKKNAKKKYGQEKHQKQNWFR